MLAKSTLLYITLAVSQLDQAASDFSQRGFTLKKPHHYKKGNQKGIVTQSILFEDGSSLQLLSVKKAESPLAKWYQKAIQNNRSGGTQVVLQNNQLKEVAKNFSQSPLYDLFKLEEHPQYSWLSFKTQSDYAHLAFLQWKRPPQFTSELFQHPNETQGIKKILLRPVGDPMKWVQIIKNSHSQESGLDFSGLFTSGNSFVEKIILKTRKKPLPKAFKVGSTQVEFHSF